MRKCSCEAASLREGSHGREGLMGMHVGREVMTNICKDRQEERGRERRRTGKVQKVENFNYI